MLPYNEIKSIIKDQNAVIREDFNKPSGNSSTLTSDCEDQRLIG